MADFHFIRPLWLLLLIAAVAMPLILKRFRSSDSGWSRIIPAYLLTPIISRSGVQGQPMRSPMVPLTLTLAVLAIALAGPSWREAPTPLQQQNDSLVIVLDLSLSMLATDAEPDRLTVAKRKIRDILDVRDGSLTALVVYSADAHVVTPLTDDSQTIEGMLNVLDPTIMPAAGNRADLGIEQGLRLLEQGAPGQGRLLLIADSVSDRYASNIDTAFSGSPFSLSTLAVGTTEGGPIPLARKGFIRDNGEVVITRADPQGLTSLAQAHGGKGQSLSISNQDILNLDLRAEDSDDWQESDRGLTVDRWQDDGYWLLWLAAPLALIGWRRGAMIALFLTLVPLAPRPASAQSWDALWLREDQRASEMIREDAAKAARNLEDPDLKGSALYRSGNYEAAVDAFSAGDEPSANYNRGNALARAGKLKEAIKAYDQALEMNPDNEDAAFNRKLVKDLLEQQQQNQSGEDGDSSQDSSESSDDQQQQGSENPSQGENQSGDQQESESGSDQQQSSGQQQDSEGDEPEDKDSQQEPQSGDQESEKQDSPESESAAPAELDTSPLSQGQEQLLRRVPDDPGGLLRRKFLQQYQQRNSRTDEGDTPW